MSTPLPGPEAYSCQALCPARELCHSAEVATEKTLFEIEAAVLFSGANTNGHDTRAQAELQQTDTDIEHYRQNAGMLLYTSGLVAVLHVRLRAQENNCRGPRLSHLAALRHTVASILKNTDPYPHDYSQDSRRTLLARPVCRQPLVRSMAEQVHDNLQANAGIFEAYNSRPIAVPPLRSQH